MARIFRQLHVFLHHKDNFYTQFIKYVFCGGISVLVDQLVFYALAWRAFPALRLSDPVAKLLALVGLEVQEVTEDQLRLNYWIIKVICFVASNAVVYLLNVLFVFNTGRHKKGIEILLFFGSSLFQFFFIWLGGVLIIRFGWEVTYSNITMLMTSMVVNFMVRKKVVFKS